MAGIDGSGIHPLSGHRMRLKKRYTDYGIEGLEPVKALELLLFYALPRRETATIAEELLARFGSLSAVLEASGDELLKVKGVGEDAARFLKLVPDIGKICLAERVSRSGPLDTADAVCDFLEPYFLGSQTEEIYLLCLDAKNRPLGCLKLGEGAPGGALLDVRRLIEIALCRKAACVVLAHSHPGGVAEPSDEDVRTTYRIKSALNAVQIRLLDHFIFSEAELPAGRLKSLSFAASGYL